MSDSDDSFIVGLPTARSDSGSGDSFVLGGAVPRGRGFPAGPEIGGDSASSASGASDDLIMGGEIARRRRTRNRARAQAQTTGGLWALATVGDGGVPKGQGPQDVFALLQVNWSLQEPDYTVQNSFDVGRLEYVVDRCLPLQSPVTLPDDIGASAASLLRAEMLCDTVILTMEDGSSMGFKEFVATADIRFRCLLGCSQEESTKLTNVTREAPASPPLTTLRSTPVYSRGRYPCTIGQQPSSKDLRLWRAQVRDAYKECGGARGPDVRARDLDPLLYLPVGDRFEHYSAAEVQNPRRPQVRGRQQIDPVRVIEAINVAQHLRQPALFQTVLEGCIDYLGLEEANPAIEHEYSLDPTRRHMDKSLARADAVAMNLTRRKFKQWRKDDAIRSISVYSDASPVVGAELQGMLIDVNFKDNTTFRITLPGSTLAYGFAGSMSKSVSLLHALWLIVGPSADDVRWVNSKIRSFTTDFGVEMHLLEAPDIVDAYIAYLDGQPLLHVAPLVKHDVRMWAYALRMAGWSHVFGGIMKTAGEKFPHWPRYLKNERVLCPFFKNITYRQHIIRLLGPQLPDLRV